MSDTFPIYIFAKRIKKIRVGESPEEIYENLAVLTLEQQDSKSVPNLRKSKNEVCIFYTKLPGRFDIFK